MPRQAAFESSLLSRFQNIENTKLEKTAAYASSEEKATEVLAF